MLCFDDICTEHLKILECDQKSFKKKRYFEFIVVCKTLYIYVVIIYHGVPSCSTELEFWAL